MDIVDSTHPFGDKFSNQYNVLSDLSRMNSIHVTFEPFMCRAKNIVYPATCDNDLFHNWIFRIMKNNAAFDIILMYFRKKKILEKTVVC